MTEYIYDTLGLIDLAARTAESISAEGIFICNSDDKVYALKEEAKKLNVKYDDTLSHNEFGLDLLGSNIRLYQNFEHFITLFPQRLLSTNYYGYHCCYAPHYQKLQIMEVTKDTCFSYCFVEKNEIDNNIIFSLSNVFYWEQIYNLLQKIGETRSINRIVTIRSIAKGERCIKYEPYTNRFDTINLKEKYIKLSNIIEKTNAYPMLLKNRLVENILNTSSTSITNIILELDGICDKARNDYEIATYKIDFESYIKTYDSEVDNFIDKTRTIIDRLIANIFSIPLLYAGAIFTFEKVDASKNKKFILIAVTIYTVLSIILMIYHIIDTITIEKKFDDKITFFTNGSNILKGNTTPDSKNMKSRLWFIRIFNVVLIVVFISLLINLYLTFS